MPGPLRDPGPRVRDELRRIAASARPGPSEDAVTATGARRPHRDARADDVPGDGTDEPAAADDARPRTPGDGSGDGSGPADA